MKVVRIGAKTVELGKRLGRGGEGDVFAFASDPSRAIKVYKESLRSCRRDKVEMMIKLDLFSMTDLVAFPDETVFDASGNFIGFSMRLMAKCRPIHDLYSPKSRKHHFSGKDYRFLVRAARNLAVAVAKVHQLGCIIGDFNHSGVFVSDDATIALIDADSFQVRSSGRFYPCLVGVADFTPPELHGADLATTPRTEVHDHFGLAVAIFHLLAMGRHPYAGRYRGGDLSLGDAIAQHRFAFSKSRQEETRCSPPPGSVLLDDFSPQISAAFEAAFGRNPIERPSTTSWIALLSELENALTRCSAEKSHYYPSAARKCVWCRLAAQSGVDMFPDSLTQGSWDGASFSNFDLDKLVSQVRAIRLPSLDELVPKWTGTSVVSPAARKAKRDMAWGKLTGIAIIVGSIAAIAYIPAIWFIWIALGVVGFSRLFGKVVDTQPFQRAYEQAQEQLANAERAFGDRIGLTEMQTLSQQFAGWVEAYKKIDPELSRAITHLKSTREARQREAFLDRFPIRRANLSGIGPTKIATLASFGIETAADVKKNAILQVPGFGEVLTETLLQWRRRLEGRFRFDPTPNQTDAQAENSLKSTASKRRSELQGKIANTARAMAQASANLRSRAVVGNDQLRHLQESVDSARVNLEFLNIPIPARRVRPQRQPSQPIAPSSAARATPPATHVTKSCPRCGSRMVKRTARRGYNTGGQFWGCSRYPSCKGTRPA